MSGDGPDNRKLKGEQDDAQPNTGAPPPPPPGPPPPVTTKIDQHGKTINTVEAVELTPQQEALKAQGEAFVQERLGEYQAGSTTKSKAAGQINAERTRLMAEVRKSPAVIPFIKNILFSEDGHLKKEFQTHLIRLKEIGICDSDGNPTQEVIDDHASVGMLVKLRNLTNNIKDEAREELDPKKPGIIGRLNRTLNVYQKNIQDQEQAIEGNRALLKQPHMSKAASEIQRDIDARVRAIKGYEQQVHKTESRIEEERERLRVLFDLLQNQFPNHYNREVKGWQQAINSGCQLPKELKAKQKAAQESQVSEQPEITINLDQVLGNGFFCSNIAHFIALNEEQREELPHKPNILRNRVEFLMSGKSAGTPLTIANLLAVAVGYLKRSEGAFSNDLQILKNSETDDSKKEMFQDTFRAFVHQSVDEQESKASDEAVFQKPTDEQILEQTRIVLEQVQTDVSKAAGKGPSGRSPSSAAQASPSSGSEASRLRSAAAPSSAQPNTKKQTELGEILARLKKQQASPSQSGKEEADASQSKPQGSKWDLQLNPTEKGGAMRPGTLPKGFEDMSEDMQRLELNVAQRDLQGAQHQAEIAAKTGITMGGNRPIDQVLKGILVQIDETGNYHLAAAALRGLMVRADEFTPEDKEMIMRFLNFLDSRLTQFKEWGLTGDMSFDALLDAAVDTVEKVRKLETKVKELETPQTMVKNKNLTRAMELYRTKEGKDPDYKTVNSWINDSGLSRSDKRNLQSEARKKLRG